MIFWFGVTSGQDHQLYTEAKQLYSQGKYHEAIAKLDKIAGTGSIDFDVWLMRGDCLQKEEKFVAAIGAYEEAERFNSLSPALYTNSGAAFLSLKQYAEAEKKFKKALKLDPGYSEAHYFMGNLRFEQYNPGVAVKHYSEAIKTRPEYRDALYMRAACYAELGRYRDALRDYEAVLKISPDLEEARLNIAVIYLEADEYEKAATLLEEVSVSKLSNQIDFYYYLGEALYFSGKKEKACEYYAIGSELGDAECKDLHLKYCVDKQTREAMRQKRTIRAAF